MLHMLGLSRASTKSAERSDPDTRPGRSETSSDLVLASEMLAAPNRATRTTLLPPSALGLRPGSSLHGRQHVYGYIGAADMTMYPFILPPVIVQIDTSQRRIVNSRWQCELERPIYFYELRGGFACGWCERRQSTITLLAHPLSPGQSHTFAYPREIEVIGRVTMILMRLGRQAGEAISNGGTLRKESSSSAQQCGPSAIGL